MTILDKNSIDIINIDDDLCTLIITDHLEWVDNEHFILLKDKLNLYIHYIESGQVYKNNDVYVGMKIVIKLICKFQPKSTDLVILDGIINALYHNNIIFRYEISN